MNKHICLVRIGNLGDVLLSEPIAASFLKAGWRVDLCTSFVDIGLCLDSYSVVRPFSDYIDGRLYGYDRIHLLRYELHRNMHHLDAYAEDAGVALLRRIPQLRVNFGRLLNERYGLICPDTSSWMTAMRRWPSENFAELQYRLSSLTPLQWVVLENRHSFVQMMSLIQHAECIVANDSGPAHIAQSMGRHTIVLFGATSPEYILTGAHAAGVLGSVGCHGCRHVALDRSMACAEPICIQSISVDQVIESVLRKLSV